MTKISSDIDKTKIFEKNTLRGRLKIYCRRHVPTLFFSVKKDERMSFRI